MHDPLDQPDDDQSWGLVIPFIVCTSQGGPYQDEAFVAGFQAGQLDQRLAMLALAGGQRTTAMVRTALVPLLELIAMNRGFPTVTAEPVQADPDRDTPAMPDWSTITFATPEGTDAR